MSAWFLWLSEASACCDYPSILDFLQRVIFSSWLSSYSNIIYWNLLLVQVLYYRSKVANQNPRGQTSHGINLPLIGQSALNQIRPSATLAKRDRRDSDPTRADHRKLGLAVVTTQFFSRPTAENKGQQQPRLLRPFLDRRLQKWLLSTRSPTTRHRGRTPPSWRLRSPARSSTWRATHRT